LDLIVCEPTGKAEKVTKIDPYGIGGNGRQGASNDKRSRSAGRSSAGRRGGDRACGHKVDGPDGESAVGVGLTKRQDHDILLMTGVLWAAQLGVLISRSEATGISAGGEAAFIRLIIALIGAASTLAIYWLLRGRVVRATTLFAMAVLLCLPLSFALALLNEVIWLFAADYYQNMYGMGQWQLLAHRPDVLLKEAVFTAVIYLWVYVSWCALYVGSVFASELRDRETRLAAAESAAQEARLFALRVQLNPHFLFNTLNTLSGLIALDRKDVAEGVVLNLSTLLRHSLSGTPDQLITLAEEIEIQKLYLDIERIRFADRLTIRMEIEPQCGLALVPPLLLQPLVENAVRHAVACSTSEVVLTIRAQRRGDRLGITIENSAPSERPGSAPRGFGIGLANVSKRLAALFGDKATLDAGPLAAGGWSNRIELPWMEHRECAS
jgi:two-component system LytT family sensor kinase